MEEWVRLFEETLNRILKISIQDSIFLRANLEAGDICDGRGVGGGNERRLYSQASCKDKQSNRKITGEQWRAPPVYKVFTQHGTNWSLRYVLVRKGSE